jgi:class 3 adenylate cyclase
VEIGVTISRGEIGARRTIDRLTPAAWGRVGLTLAALLYAFLRFGSGVGARVLPAAILILLLEAVRLAQRARDIRAIVLDSIAAALQPAIILGLCFAPAPFGFGSDVPGRVMMDTQVFILVLCFLASNADAANPAPLWSCGAAILLMWLNVERWIFLDPHTITVANLHVSMLKTPLSFLRAQNDPHFFNFTMFRGSLVSAAMITAALGFGLYRTRRLARMAAGAEAARSALAAFFSPQVTEAILTARDGAMAPQENEVAALDCDLVGFTTLAESLPPEDVAALLRAWRSVVEEAVFAENGAILSHTGDGTVALFGFAGNREDCVAHAVAAAKRIAQAWPSASTALVNAPPAAIGIDFGAARVGLVGERMLSFLASGPVLQSAETLQRETRGAGSPILVGDGAARELQRRAPQESERFEQYAKDGLRAWKLWAE